MNWYILYTEDAQEYKVSKSLMDKLYMVYLPENKLSDSKNNWIKQPLYPGYVFVKCFEEDVEKIKNIKGVINLVYYKENYAIAHEEEVEHMKHFLDEHPSVKKEIMPVNTEVKTSIVKKLVFNLIGNLVGPKHNQLRLHLPSLGVVLLAETEEVKNHNHSELSPQHEGGKSGDIDHPYPVQSDHLKLTSVSCIKRAAFVC